MKSVVVVAAFALIASACASDSGVVKTGTDTYIITKQQPDFLASVI